MFGNGGLMAAVPQPSGKVAWRAFRSLTQQGHVLTALETLHSELGDVFKIPLPGFRVTMLVGPEANRFLLMTDRIHFLWRAENDPVTRLLRHGVLVEDGDFHDELRDSITPSLHRARLEGYVETMWRCVDQVTKGWGDETPRDQLVEMRKIALLTLTKTLFAEDVYPHLKTIWQPILDTIRYISPGPWLLWRDVPQPRAHRAIERMDSYLRQLIVAHRASLGEPTDLLGELIASSMSDELIRDQLLTLLIAGHDTSTALLAWALYLLVTHSETYARARQEVDRVLGAHPPTYHDIGQLSYLDCVIKETLRLYPPIHLGSRIAATDIEFQEYTFPAGTRVMYSIYLTHRRPEDWPDPQRFDPDRFAPEQRKQQTPYSFVPFGGGPRNCLGAVFAQVEAKVILARILQTFDARYVGGAVRPRMAATLEPHPGVMVKMSRRQTAGLASRDRRALST
jgi:cytochrome P450